MNFLCNLLGHLWFHRDLKGYWNADANREGWECERCHVAGEIVSVRRWSIAGWIFGGTGFFDGNIWTTTLEIRPAGKVPL